MEVQKSNTSSPTGDSDKSISEKMVMVGGSKPYTLRRLNSSDLWLMTKIISKIGINEWVPCLQSPKVMELIRKITEKPKNTSDDQSERKEDVTEEKDGSTEFIAGAGVVLEIVNKLLTHLPDCQEEIYQLLSNISNIRIKELKVMDAEIFIEMLVDFIKKDEFTGFFRAASRLIK